MSNTNEFPYNWSPPGTLGLRLKNVLIRMQSEISHVASSGVKNIKVGGSNLPITDGTIELGSASTKEAGTSQGNVPELDNNGKLPTSVIPSIAVVDTYICTDQSITTLNELATWSNAQTPIPERGDVIIVNNDSDIIGNYIVTTETVIDDSSFAAFVLPEGAVSSITISGVPYTPVNGVVSIDVDTSPIEGSGKVITSGAVYTGLNGKQDTITAGSGIIKNSNELSVDKEIINNPALTTNGVTCTWEVITDRPHENPLIQIIELATGQVVMSSITITDSTHLVVSISSTTDVAADIYKIIVL